jgi:hypothetical protein
VVGGTRCTGEQGLVGSAAIEDSRALTAKKEYRVYAIIDTEYGASHRKVSRMHLAVNDSVCAAVVEDLESRFGPQKVTTEIIPGKPLQQIYHIDFGGVARVNWEPVAIVIDGFRFTFYAHHVDSLYASLNRSLEKPRKGGYVKIHTWLSSLCVPISMAEQLLAAIKENDEDIRKTADEEFADHARIMRDLARCKHIYVREDVPGDEN